jgi:hypothetical protein
MDTAEPPDITPQTWNSRMHLENADFWFIRMSTTGKLLIRPSSYFFFVDDSALENGLLLLCTFEVNGGPKYQIRLGPFDIWWPCCMLNGMGKNLEQVLGTYFGVDEEEFNPVCSPE